MDTREQSKIPAHDSVNPHPQPLPEAPTNEEVLERIENAERDKDSLYHVKPKCRTFDEVLSKELVSKEFAVEYIKETIGSEHLTREIEINIRHAIGLIYSEHEAILGQRINEGYEWTRQQLNKYEAQLAAKDKEIAELNQIAEWNKAAAEALQKTNKDLQAQRGDLQQRLAVAMEALEFYATAPCAPEILEIAPRFREVAQQVLAKLKEPGGA